MYFLEHSNKDSQIIFFFFSADNVTLQMVLAFFTGSDSLPPLGLLDATLSFNSRNAYPCASACMIELKLPTKFREYSMFKMNMDIAFTKLCGFQII